MQSQALATSGLAVRQKGNGEQNEAGAFGKPGEWEGITHGGRRALCMRRKEQARRGDGKEKGGASKLKATQFAEPCS